MEDSVLLRRLRALSARLSLRSRNLVVTTSRLALVPSRAQIPLISVEEKTSMVALPSIVGGRGFYHSVNIFHHSAVSILHGEGKYETSLWL